MSDLHLEFGNLSIPESPDDKDTVLVLAGDVGLAKKSYTYQYFLEEMSERFRAIIYIMGNHEFYHGSLRTALAKIWNAVLDCDNVYVVENETVIIDHVAFVCATLWSDFDKCNPLVMQAVADKYNGMNDYNYIRTGPNDDNAYQRPIRPDDVFILHNESKKFIFEEIAKQKEAGNKVMVVTHMGPSYQSIAEQYRRGRDAYFNGAYVSELSNEILDTEPEVWVHGHTHVSFDYLIGNTRVICNPRGYAKDDLNPEFNVELTVEL